MQSDEMHNPPQNTQLRQEWPATDQANETRRDDRNGRAGGRADLCPSYLRLKIDGSKLCVDLKFKSLEDFSPERVVNHIEPLRKLLEARQRLADLRNKMACNDKFEELLSDVLHNTDQITKLSQELPAPDKEE